MFAFRSNIALPRTWVVTWLCFKVFYVCFPNSISVFWNGKYQQHKDTSKCNKRFPCSGHCVMVCLLTGMCYVLLLRWEICILGGKTVVSAIYINILPWRQSHPYTCYQWLPHKYTVHKPNKVIRKAKGGEDCVWVCVWANLNETWVEEMGNRTRKEKSMLLLLSLKSNALISGSQLIHFT